MKIGVQSAPMDTNEDPSEKAKARRTIRILYALIFVFIVGPVLLYFFLN